MAAEQEAARVAAEQEAAQQEAARLAAEQEAAQQEAARLAAEQEAARLAAEQIALQEMAAQFATPAPQEPPVWENTPAAASYDEQFTPTFEDANTDLANRLVEFAATAVTTEPADAPGFEETHALSSFNEIDTAVLLRELSSLGDEEPSAPRAAPARPTAPRPAAVADKDKKRKGLFGR
jgi:hypothetical protein